MHAVHAQYRNRYERNKKHRDNIQIKIILIY